ncbi:hypothetical protein EON82_07175 [bacterium]|nr:MAG: hypothetical protein EON82_07175 [bacterium]
MLLIVVLPMIVSDIAEPFVGKANARFVFGGTLFAVFLINYLIWIRGKGTDRKSLSVPEDAFGDQFAADVKLMVEGVPLAADRGVVWFAEGLMGFSGRSFSYVLAASDLSTERNASRRENKGKYIPTASLALAGAPKTAHVVVEPLYGHAQPYRERLRVFMAANESPQGERIWPPLSPYSESPSIAQGGGKVGTLGK